MVELLLNVVERYRPLCKSPAPAQNNHLREPGAGETHHSLHHSLTLSTFQCGHRLYHSKPFVLFLASLMVQWWRICLTMQHAQVRSLGQKILGEEMATHSKNKPCLGNPMDRGAWQAAAYGAAKESDTAQQPYINRPNSKMFFSFLTSYFIYRRKFLFLCLF